VICHSALLLLLLLQVQGAHLSCMAMHCCHISTYILEYLLERGFRARCCALGGVALLTTHTLRCTRLLLLLLLLLCVWVLLGMQVGVVLAPHTLGSVTGLLGVSLLRPSDLHGPQINQMTLLLLLLLLELLQLGVLLQLELLLLLRVLLLNSRPQGVTFPGHLQLLTSMPTPLLLLSLDPVPLLIPLLLLLLLQCSHPGSPGPFQQLALIVRSSQHWGLVPPHLT
jgi:hypothetical protein